MRYAKQKANINVHVMLAVREWIRVQVSVLRMYICIVPKLPINYAELETTYHRYGV